MAEKINVKVDNDLGCAQVIFWLWVSLFLLLLYIRLGTISNTLEAMQADIHRTSAPLVMKAR